MPLIRVYHPSPRTFTDAKERKALADAVCAFFIFQLYSFSRMVGLKGAAYLSWPKFENKT